MDVIKDYLIFGGVDNRDYGIEVFFKDVDHVPKRVYERIEVPGRNGAVLIDEGRYEDVPVTYDCIALNDIDRSRFVNALASQIGYQRMQDSFNDDEFYSAVFEGNVDPNVTKDRAQSTFTVNFTRSAQRYLISGETELTLESGDILTNPTLFESSPLLEVEGYGKISFNGYEIEIENVQAIGDVVLINAGSSSVHFPARTYDSFNGNEAFLNAGDTITVPSITVTVVETVKPAVVIQSVTRESLQDLSEATIRASSSRTIEVVLKSLPIKFQYGTSGTSVVGQASFGWILYDGPSGSTLNSPGMQCTVFAEYDGDKTITFRSSGLHLSTVTWYDDSAKKIEYSPVIGTSTQEISLGHIYIDCDLGEAYKIESGGAISLNRYIDLGSDLPKLASGDNTISYDNTITELKITPRWWKI